MKYIDTLDELKKYLGKIVFFYYTANGKKDGIIIFAWAKKITKIELNPFTREKDDSITSVNVYGINTVCFVTTENNPYPKLMWKSSRKSNAQQFARELTATELIMYRRALMKN